MIDMLGHYFNLFAEVRHSKDAQLASAGIALSGQPESRLDLGHAEKRQSPDEDEREAAKEDLFFWMIPPLI